MRAPNPGESLKCKKVMNKRREFQNTQRLLKGALQDLIMWVLGFVIFCDALTKPIFAGYPPSF